MLAHFLAEGAARKLDPHPLFDTGYYLSQLQSGESCDDPIDHFLTVGASRGLNPHKLFDTAWYLDHYTDVAEAGLNPLVHYIEHGAIEGRLSGPDFDGGWYLDEYEDVAAAGVNPLVHFSMHGEGEGRFASHLAKQSKLVTVNAGVINIGHAFSLEDTDWHGPQTLLEPPVRPTVTLDPVQLADHKVASFDVWDTLIHRRCHPEEIKLASARALLLGFHRWLKPELQDLNALYRGRLAAEAQVSFGDDREYRFSEAAIAWAENSMVQTASSEVMTAAVEHLLTHEIRAETNATFRNTAMDPIFEALSGRTIVFASDFYLPSEALQRLLTTNGIDCNFARAYSSCEDGRSKRSGAMFTRILDDLGVHPQDIVHVGDNRDADVTAATKAGLTAVYHEVERLPALDAAVEERIAGDDDTYEAFIGASLAKTAASLPAPKNDQDELRRLGVRFAPVAVGLALRIVEEAVTNGIEKIFFFTREGLFLKQLVDQVIAADPYGVAYPETELLEVSRKATFAASLDSFTADELMRIWTVYSTQSPRGLAASLNINTERAEQVFGRQGLDFDEPVRYPWQNEQFQRAMTEPSFKAETERSMARQRELLRGYAASKGMHDGNSMIVDLGWRGTIQDNLSRAIDLPLRGIYLGLFSFLNEQPTNSEKVGWLFDHNDTDRDAWTVDEVAPLEMLFNAVGGSVTGYERDADGDYVALRHVDSDEEAVIAQRVVHFQEGIIDALPGLVDLTANHALTSAQFRPLARKLVQGVVRQPPALIAEAFFNLSHNETFGTGTFDDMRKLSDLKDTANTLERGALYTALADAGEDCRWPEGLGAASQAILRTIDGPRPIHVPTRIFASSADITSKGSVGLFAPAPIIGSGGHRTIYNLAKGIAATGLDVQLFLDGFGAGLDDVVSQLRGSGVTLAASWDTSTRFDYAIATVAASAAHVEKTSANGRGYLVQDFEAYFNPVSDGYISAESSYTDAFDFLTVGSWLGHVLETRYGSRAFSSGLGANLEVYRPLDAPAAANAAMMSTPAGGSTVERENAVCFLYQPEKPRRTPQLGIKALELLKRACPDVSVYVYGSDADIDLDFDVENLGLIRDLDQLNELYNRCKVGLCISMTNPSRIPFELMAAGTVPVDVYRYNTLFDYEDDTAALAYQSPESLAAAMIELLTSDEAYQSRRQRCLEFITNRPLGWETDVMVNAVLARISGVEVEPTASTQLYTAPPIIAAQDNSESTKAFCEWQRRSASR
jgi:HAD superfamily hydrolase (TIGR01549 family)